MKRTFVFMRTHVITKGVISEFLKLKNSTEFDCVLFVDNHKKNIAGKTDENSAVRYLDFCDEMFKDIKCFLFDEDIFKSLKLPYYAKKNSNKSLTNVMWYCADYAFYAVKKYFPGYDYYWHFDYDVFCNGTSYKPFFDKYNDKDTDLIVSGLNPVGENSDWVWLEKTDWIYDKKLTKYNSFFPIVRLSSSAIDFLYKKRMEMSAIFSRVCKNKNNRWLNCELFVPTELLNNGFTGVQLHECLRFTPNYDLNEDRIFEKPDNKIYHPVKGDYEQKLSLCWKKISEMDKYGISLFGTKLGIFFYRETD